MNQNEGGKSAFETDYDALPYLSLPIAYTQPARLAAMAALHGLPFPAPSRARVLELGCASGGNLLPLAARWPDAHFVGLDLSAQQIADGQKRVAYFGLRNVQLTQADLAEVRLPPRSFDYVICHGVFSWVPPAIQEATLRLIGDCLSADGIAAISFNVLPGWHLRSPMRAYLRHHARNGPPRERVARARAALAALNRDTGGGAYGALMRAEAKLLEKMPSSYIMGEFLAEHNHALPLLDFVAAAQQHGLDYIAEADFEADARALLNSDGIRHIDQLEQIDRMRAAQELDFVSGRPFRRTLLRRHSASHPPRAPSTTNLAGLHVAALLRPVPDAQGFLDRHGQRVIARTPEMQAILAKLNAAYPSTLAVDELLAELGSRRDEIAGWLLSFVQSGHALVMSSPLSVGRGTGAHPKVWPYARAEAALGLPSVTSLHHVAVALPKSGAAIAALADGTRTISELASLLAVDLDAGRIAPLKEAPDVPVASIVADTLRHLAASAALEA